MKWPDDYWPVDPAPPGATSWAVIISAYGRSLEQVKKLARDVSDLTAKVPTGKESQTYLFARF